MFRTGYALAAAAAMVIGRSSGLTVLDIPDPIQSDPNREPRGQVRYRARLSVDNPGRLSKASPARSSTIRKFQRGGRPGKVSADRLYLYLNGEARRLARP